MDSPLRSIDERLLATIPPSALKTLLDASIALGSSLDLGETLERTVEGATELLHLDTGAVYTVDGEVLLLGATVPALPPDFPDELRRASIHDHPTIRRALATGTSVVVEDALKADFTPAERAVVDARDLRSVLYMPLMMRDEPIGVFIVGSSAGHRHHFAEADMDLARAFAALASAAVSNACLMRRARRAVDDLTRAYNSTIEGWSRVLDLRDHETDRHSLRVADLTVALAREMGIGEPAIGDLRRGALLHDIGKIGVPDAILNKPGALAPEERAVMETHPTLAREILSTIDFLEPALDIPYCHHEKWDGSGYPRGLKGHDIPLAARLFAIVDVYDALTSDRPYRAAWSRKAAIEFIRGQSRIHFDPTVVDVFLSVIGSRGPHI